MATAKKTVRPQKKSPTEFTFLTVHDVAALFQISPRNVRRRCKASQLPQPIRIGRLVRWRMADIQAWQGNQSDPNRAA